MCRAQRDLSGGVNIYVIALNSLILRKKVGQGSPTCQPRKSFGEELPDSH